LLAHVPNDDDDDPQESHAWASRAGVLHRIMRYLSLYAIKLLVDPEGDGEHSIRVLDLCCESAFQGAACLVT
jgi:hypothetical protein